LGTKRELQKSLAALGVFLVCCIFLFLFSSQPWSFPFASTDCNKRTDFQWHPTQHLMEEAEMQHFALLAKRTVGLHSAAQAYRLARGPTPASRIRQVVHVAQKHDSNIMEDFFDQIYHDLTPFWDLAAKDMRQFAETSVDRISIRMGAVLLRTSQAKESAEPIEVWLYLS
jgi:hypothetical protein